MQIQGKNRITLIQFKSILEGLIEERLTVAVEADVNHGWLARLSSDDRNGRRGRGEVSVFYYVIENPNS